MKRTCSEAVQYECIELDTNVSQQLKLERNLAVRNVDQKRKKALGPRAVHVSRRTTRLGHVWATLAVACPN